MKKKVVIVDLRRDM